MAERLPEGLEHSTVSENLVEFVMGDPLEWVPTTPWPGDAGAPVSVAPCTALAQGREALKSLLWRF